MGLIPIDKLHSQNDFYHKAASLWLCHTTFLAHRYYGHMDTYIKVPSMGNGACKEQPRNKRVIKKHCLAQLVPKIYLPLQSQPSWEGGQSSPVAEREGEIARQTWLPAKPHQRHSVFQKFRSLQNENIPESSPSTRSTISINLNENTNWT